MKKVRGIIIFILASILILPLSLITYDIFSQPQFDKTYYGELVNMHNKLKNTEEKKIVIIGNSNVAFGVDSKLLEEKLSEVNLDYKVCNFGLYGSIGTKVMLDLSKADIKKDDIVIFVPEINSQALSLYFNALEFYRSSEKDRSLFFELSSSSKETTVGNYTSYLAEKLTYSKKESTLSDSIYMESSFDDNCDLKNYKREYNIMPSLYDENNLIDFSVDLIDDEFFSYVNEYYQDIKEKGAEMYYSFPPINKKAISCDNEQILKFYDAIDSKIDFQMLSNPNNYIMDPLFFYNSNFHLNDVGMEVRTLYLLSDIENLFSINKKNYDEIPTPPEVPAKIKNKEGDNSDIDCFNYTLVDEEYVISSLTLKGMEKDKLIIPCSYNDKLITSFDANTFKGDTNLKELTIQSNIEKITDYSFSDCISLTKIYLTHEKASDIAVGYHLLDNTDALIYVKSEYIESFLLDYTWGYYGKKIKEY